MSPTSSEGKLVHTVAHDIADAGGGHYRSQYSTPSFLEHLMKVGELVFIDSIGGGLVPAKVLDIERHVVHDGNTSALDRIMHGRITVQVTADRPGYKKGEHISCLPSAVVARRAVHVRSGQYRITQLNYAYEVTPCPPTT